jgi:hypothetical protein
MVMPANSQCAPAESEMTVNVPSPRNAAAPPEFDRNPRAHVIRSDAEAIETAKIPPKARGCARVSFATLAEAVKLTSAADPSINAINPPRRA